MTLFIIQLVKCLVSLWDSLWYMHSVRRVSDWKPSRLNSVMNTGWTLQRYPNFQLYCISCNIALLTVLGPQTENLGLRHVSIYLRLMHDLHYMDLIQPIPVQGAVLNSCSSTFIIYTLSILTVCLYLLNGIQRMAVILNSWMFLANFKLVRGLAQLLT